MAPTLQSKFHKKISSSNPFDSDLDSETNIKPTRASSAPVLTKGSNKILQSSDINNHFSSSSYHTRKSYKNDLDLENQSVQELEGYAVYKAEETTKSVNECLKIAEEIREDASKTLVNLHHQGEQITRTHMTAADIEHDLSRGEKLLGSLGSLFSRTWRPKKNREIKGPVLIPDNFYTSNNTEQKQRMELHSTPVKQSSNLQKFNSEPASVMEKVQMEKEKQEDALTDLSNLLGELKNMAVDMGSEIERQNKALDHFDDDVEELKNMAVDMGSEIERQNKALDHFDDDVEELNFRVRGANIRGRRLLGK